MLQEKRFGFNEEMIAEIEAYFEIKDESFHKKSVEKLEKRWNQCITLEGNYVNCAKYDFLCKVMRVESRSSIDGVERYFH